MSCIDEAVRCTDCKVGEWAVWAECSSPCGGMRVLFGVGITCNHFQYDCCDCCIYLCVHTGGNQTHSRSILVEAAGVARACAARSETQDCNMRSCSLGALTSIMHNANNAFCIPPGRRVMIDSFLFGNYACVQAHAYTVAVTSHTHVCRHFTALGSGWMPYERNEPSNN